MTALRAAPLIAAVMAAPLCLPGTATAAVYSGIENPFDISVIFDVDDDGIADSGGLTASQRDVFIGAELFWESLLLGNRYDFALSALSISARGVAMDGVNGILGSAGWTSAVLASGPSVNYVYATSGLMEFDTADIDALESAGTLFDVIVHEMAHVIGFGTLWTVGADFGVPGVVDPYVTGSGAYGGAFANALYALEFGATGGFIPVELDGGPGTAGGHWDEVAFAGGERDIMTGFLNGASPLAEAPFGASTLSDTTIASFADIGYITVATDIVAAVPLPAGMVLSLTGLLGLGAVSRRRRRAA